MVRNGFLPSYTSAWSSLADGFARLLGEDWSVDQILDLYDEIEARKHGDGRRGLGLFVCVPNEWA